MRKQVRRDTKDGQGWRISLCLAVDIVYHPDGRSPTIVHNRTQFKAAIDQAIQKLRKWYIEPTHPRENAIIAEAWRKINHGGDVLNYTVHIERAYVARLGEKGCEFKQARFSQPVRGR